MKRFGFAVVLLVLCTASVDASMSKAEAKKLIAEFGLPETPDGMLAYLNVSSPETVKLLEAYLTLGVRADREITYQADGNQTLTRYPLTYLLMFSCADPSVALKAKLLLDAGADPNTTDPENESAALAQVHSCPEVMRVILAAKKKPNVNRVDRNGNTVMHWVLSYADEKVETIRMLLDAGFDLAPWRSEFIKEAKRRNDPALIEIFGGTPAAVPSRPAPTPAPATAGRTDWKALPPYPTRSEADAKKLLHRPGAATTIDEHMWDGITSREPLRLAAALQAGADVRQTRPGTGYTPLVLLAERCDEKDAEIQSANARLLIAAGADLQGTDANGATALVLAAGDCPIGVVQALLDAGASPHIRTQKGATALRNAISEGRADVVAALLDAGVDPKKEPYNARALASGNREIEALLKKGPRKRK
ncbi:MAG: ankyrin repeat domain-containing protein [Thermoanaerobaculia bacterium]